MEDNRFKYDVALSFSGDDRPYVKEVANLLIANGIKVFYDESEKESYWGKNLYIHLQRIYRDLARFTIIFISKSYSRRVWTNHEMQAAQARALSENKEYILPARFDDTPIPGLLETISYIDISQLTPTEFVEIIKGKLKQEIVTKRERISKVDNEVCKILIKREKKLGGSAVGFRIRVNQTEIGSIWNGETTEFTLEKGDNYIQIFYANKGEERNRHGGKTGKTYWVTGSSDIINIPFQKRKKYILQCGYKPTGILGFFFSKGEGNLFLHIENIVEIKK